MAQAKIPRILIVDDEELLRELLVDVFRDELFEVTQATSGNEAIRLLGSEAYDAVVSDLRMSDGNGMDVLDCIKRARLPTPLIFMTGYSDESESECLDRGASEVVQKPFNTRELVAKVRAAIARGR